MSDYLIQKKKQILENFYDYPVVLVQIFSEQTEWNGRIVAISENCGGFPSISQVVAAGMFENGMKTTFGVTAKCLDLMALSDSSKTIEVSKELPKIERKFVEENFGCLLSIFFVFVAFILWCLLTGW